MSDQELREAVEQALEWEPIIDAKSIGVAAEGGIVTLSGHVPSYAEKREAEKVAGLVRGVRAVACELEVALPFVSERSDEEIARASTEGPDTGLARPRQGDLGGNRGLAVSAQFGRRMRAQFGGRPGCE